MRCLIWTVVLLMLGGCAAETQKKAAASAEKRCAVMGRKFVQTETLDEGGIFGTAGVVGICVGPDDPRYPKS